MAVNHGTWLLENPLFIDVPIATIATIAQRHDYHAEVCLQSGGFMPGPLPCSASSPAVSGLRPSLCSLTFHHQQNLVNPSSVTPGFAPGRMSKFPGSGWVGSLLRAPDFHAPSVGQEAMVLGIFVEAGGYEFLSTAEGAQRAYQGDQGVEMFKKTY